MTMSAGKLAAGADISLFRAGLDSAGNQRVSADWSAGSQRALCLLPCSLVLLLTTDSQCDGKHTTKTTYTLCLKKGTPTLLTLLTLRRINGF